ncbi:Beta/alpha-amylase precursor [compost metagenome]
MSNSEFTGYSVYTIDLGTATRLEVVFNNGSGTWDNNNGSNYIFPMGTVTYTPGSNNSAGSFVTGTPSS